MEKEIYKSEIDWWVWATLVICVVVSVLVIETTPWVVCLPVVGSMAMCVLLMFGCRYEIDGDDLVVYQLFKPHRFPIGKIAEVKKTIGYLATAGMSRKRVSIQFTDRSVMKSAMPLEISPKDRDGFIARLKEINPAIIVK